MEVYTKKVVTLENNERNYLKNTIGVLEDLIDEGVGNEYPIEDVIDTLEKILYQDEFIIETEE